MILKETPDTFTLSVMGEVVKLSYTNPSAVTFCLIGEDLSIVLASDNNTHPTVYNGVKTCYRTFKGRSFTQNDIKKVLKDYGTRIVRGRVTMEDLEDFMVKSQEAYGNPRYSTFSGRLWKKVTIPDLSTFSAVSFWCSRKEFNKNRIIVPTVIDAFQLVDPIYYEFIGETPKLYKDAINDDSTAKVLRSKLRPDLTQSQLIDLLVKSHTASWSLQPWEREVVVELQGKSPSVQKRIPIEQRYWSTFGDSKEQSGFLQLITEA